MQQKKIPVRMCAGCGEHFPKKELVRIVHTPQGEVHVDPTGRMAGRGAYLCRKVECLRKAQDRKSTRLNSSHNRESRMPSSA